MRSSASLLLTVLCVLALLCSVGCTPSAQSQSDEEKEPHYLEGKSRVNTLDFEGALECFEKSLEANPQSASAHFELAWLFDQKIGDPAAAIYHYQHYSKLRPAAGNLETVKQRILACKQQLARSVSLGPITEKVQRDLDSVTQESKRLTEENQKLREELESWKAYAARLQTLTNATPGVARSRQELPAVQPVPSVRLANGSPDLVRASATTTNAARSHTVKPGDTPTSIARKYGVKLEGLMAANPRLDAKRLHVGQTLVIPTP